MNISAKEIKKLVDYLFCHVVRRTTCLNFGSGLFKGLGHTLSTFGLGIGLEGPGLGLEV